MIFSENNCHALQCIACSMPSSLAVCTSSGRDAGSENMAEVADDEDGSERVVFELLGALNRTVLSGPIFLFAPPINKDLTRVSYDRVLRTLSVTCFTEAMPSLFG